MYVYMYVYMYKYAYKYVYMYMFMYMLHVCMLAPEYLATQSNSQPLPQDHSRAKCHLPFQVFPFPKGMKPPLPWLIWVCLKMLG